MDQLIKLFITGSTIIWCYATVWFVVSIIIKRNDIADVAWGGGFFLLSIWLFISSETSIVSTLLYVLVSIWAIRLSVHIYLRNRGKGEDFRYLQWRREWKKSFYLRSYLQVYLLQSVFLLIISLPLFWAAAFPISFSIMTWVGFVVWTTGFFFQSVADYQLAQFKKRKKKGEIMQSGLWKYSRHPNYFGEILMWWGVFVLVLPLPYGMLTMVSPVTITLLLVFVSGVPMLEKKYDNDPVYNEYKNRTWAIVPKLW